MLLGTQPRQPGLQLTGLVRVVALGPSQTGQRRVAQSVLMNVRLLNVSGFFFVAGVFASSGLRSYLSFGSLTLFEGPVAMWRSGLTSEVKVSN